MFNSFYILKSFLEDYERIKQLLSIDDLEEAGKIAEKWGLSIKAVDYVNDKGKTKTKIFIYPNEWNYDENSPPLKDGFLIK
jgi:hypothetical protein